MVARIFCWFERAEPAERALQRRARMGALEAAIGTWTAVLGADRVVFDRDTTTAIGGSTAGASRRVPAVIRPTTRTEVAACLAIAREHHVAVYPISTGKNWGYGSAAPVVDDCVVMDLSGMNRIVDFDPEHGVVTVEPGVTQQDLADFLAAKGARFMVPTTGAGPQASLVGNALERGYGLTPATDHFGAVTRLEAVLPSGEIYRSAMSELGGPVVDRNFKWGIGPYLDGIFSQSGFGVVTEMSIVLAPRPERIEAFFFWVERDEDLEAAVGAVREVLRTLGGIVSGVNLLNRQRALSMMVPYPHAETKPGQALPREVVDRLARENRVAAWMGVGALYGSREVLAAARKVLRRLLGPVSRRLVFVDDRRAAFAQRLLGWFPSLRTHVGRVVDTIGSTMRVLEGKPSEVALPLAYWKSGRRPPPGVPLDPQRDGCGLAWYAPLVPMSPRAVRAYVELVDRIATLHGLDPLITLTSVSDRCFDSTVPLLFDPEDAGEAERARLCLDALLEAGRREGFLPYRLGTHTMPFLVDANPSALRLGDVIKRALDPENILAPGRYASAARTAAPDVVTTAHAAE